MKTADPRVKLLWIVLCTSAALVFSKPLWLVGVGFFGGGSGNFERIFFPTPENAPISACTQPCFLSAAVVYPHWTGRGRLQG